MSRVYHGLSRHSLYYKWQSIKQRCYNNKCNNWHTYGGKGVTVCDEWKNNFKAFYKWSIDNGYSKNKVIDKDIICTKKGIIPAIYSPDTCMYITQKENNGAIKQNIKLHRENSLRLWKSGKMRYIGISIDEMSEMIECYFSVKISIRKLNRLTGVCRQTLSKYIEEAR